MPQWITEHSSEIGWLVLCLATIATILQSIDQRKEITNAQVADKTRKKVIYALGWIICIFTFVATRGSEKAAASKDYELIVLSNRLALAESTRPENQPVTEARAEIRFQFSSPTNFPQLGGSATAILNAQKSFDEPWITIITLNGTKFERYGNECYIDAEWWKPIKRVTGLEKDENPSAQELMDTLAGCTMVLNLEHLTNFEIVSGTVTLTLNSSVRKTFNIQSKRLIKNMPSMPLWAAY